MSTHRTHPAPAAFLTALLAAALTGACGSPAAAADPRASEREDCATFLSRASAWPGTMSGGGRTVRLYSDAHDSWLSRQAPCAPPARTTDDCHYGPPSVIRAC